MARPNFEDSIAGGDQGEIPEIDADFLIGTLQHSAEPRATIGLLTESADSVTGTVYGTNTEAPADDDL